MENEKHTLITLSAAELDDLKEQLLESIYADIGRSIVKKVLWILGAVAIAGFAWLAGKGHV
jgi:hypothetical protein